LQRVNVLNLNLLELPAAACMNPSPNYYKQFNGYTLGFAVALLTMAALWAIGKHVLTLVTLRGLSPEERERRLTAFNCTVLARVLLIAYIVYPGVSVAVVQMFSARRCPPATHS
jgi:hypothetical protein